MKSYPDPRWSDTPYVAMGIRYPKAFFDKSYNQKCERVCLKCKELIHHMAPFLTPRSHQDPLENTRSSQGPSFRTFPIHFCFQAELACFSTEVAAQKGQHQVPAHDEVTQRRLHSERVLGLPWCSVVKNLPPNNAEDTGLIPDPGGSNMMRSNYA